MGTLRLGDIAPDFEGLSTQGNIRLYEWMGNNWLVFFSHPADFTPVCTTELGASARLAGEFAQRNTKILALSVDTLASHQQWIPDISDLYGVEVGFPIIADPDRRIATLYDMIHPAASENFTVRSVFIIDPDKRIRLILTYPASTGRNFTELLRVIDSLQLTTYHKVATPADWKQGEEVIILPSVNDEQATELFGNNIERVKPYLRKVPQPHS